MSEQRSDYGEPWKFTSDQELETADGGYVVLEVARCQRAVACVNACAGIPDDELAGLDVRALLEFLKEKAFESVEASPIGLHLDFAIEALALARKGST